MSGAIGFLIGAQTYYKMFGPAVEEALRQGIETHLLLRNPPELQQGPKAYLRPTPATVPAFAAGAPRVHRWTSDESLLALCREHGIAAVVAIWLYPRDYALCGLLRSHGIRWISLQHGVEHFILPARSFLEADATCLYGPYWRDRTMAFYQDTEGVDVSAKIEVTGCPELDALARIDRAEVRRRYGMPADRPVVLWLPHDYHAYDLWEMLVFRRDWHPRYVWQALRRRRTDVLPLLWQGVTHVQFARALRAFCDRNDAFLVVKSRRKDRPGAADRRIADCFTFDRSYHPPTILELLAVADLCVHVFSVTAMEAAAAGVPGLCLLPPAASSFISDPHTAWRRTAEDFLAPDTLWHFEGVSRLWSLDDAVQRLPTTSLETFHMPPERRRMYLERFVGPADGESAKRLLRVVAGETVEASR